MTLRLSDAITALRTAGIRVEMPRLAGNNTALFVPVMPGVVIAIGDSGNLLTFSEGPNQELQGEFAAVVYEYDGLSFDTDDYVTPTEGGHRSDMGEFTDVQVLVREVQSTLDNFAPTEEEVVQYGPDTLSKALDELFLGQPVKHAGLVHRITGIGPDTVFDLTPYLTLKPATGGPEVRVPSAEVQILSYDEAEALGLDGSLRDQ